MYAGTAKIDITPDRPVWMDGMLRAHPSEGVHDRLFARALVLANRPALPEAWAIVSVEVCGLKDEDAVATLSLAAQRSGIPVDHIIIAATHTHSGPATMGHLTQQEVEYVRELQGKIAAVAAEAAGRLAPAAVGCASGKEETISHYRRLLADDGHVVMNWEPYPAEHIVGPLGVIDPEVGVLQVTAADDPARIVAVLFNHAGHPNVMSGDNYLLSSDYPGYACRLLEEETGAIALFVNGAQGTMDIDGLRDRDWTGVARCGNALAQAVRETMARITLSSSAAIRGAKREYTVPARRISAEEWTWAQEILQRTGGKIQSVADGVGDDYKAVLYQKLRAAEGTPVRVDQVCLAIDGTALLSFNGELYTEIGLQIKAQSPFLRTYLLGLANGRTAYIPTRKAIREGGYAEAVRRVDDPAGEMIEQKSLALLKLLADKR